MSERYQQKLRAFARFAVELGELSTCKKRRVGCLIVPHDLTEVYSIGYNGPPRGEPNDSCDCHEPGDTFGCLHAEENALIKLTRREPSTLIVTLSPCLRCCALIINTPSVERVVYLTAYKPERLRRLFNAGVQVEQLIL